MHNLPQRTRPQYEVCMCNNQYIQSPRQDNHYQFLSHQNLHSTLPFMLRTPPVPPTPSSVASHELHHHNQFQAI